MVADTFLTLCTFWACWATLAISSSSLAARVFQPQPSAPAALQPNSYATDVSFPCDGPSRSTYPAAGPDEPGIGRIGPLRLTASRNSGGRCLLSAGSPCTLGATSSIFGCRMPRECAVYPGPDGPMAPGTAR